MKDNEEKNNGIPIEPMTTVEAGCGLTVSKKIKAYLEGLEIITCLIIKDRKMRGNMEWKAYSF